MAKNPRMVTLPRMVILRMTVLGLMALTMTNLGFLKGDHSGIFGHFG